TLGIDEQATVILTVGTVSDRKGQDLVIEALADLVAQGRTDLVYVAVGRFRDPSFADLPRQLGVEDNVVFLDFVEREDLPALYAFSDIYVQPSRLSLKLKSIEGFSISTCEAMLLGKPAIVTESVGIQSVLRQLEIGLVAKSDDPDDLRDKIMLLADDVTLRQNMGAKSAQIARSSLTWATTTQEIAKVLTQVSSHNAERKS
ncbi:MAG: glycosyltransferase family 4 protein, partial [Cyanobacteria bacterium P01_F01_bin.4]